MGWPPGQIGNGHFDHGVHGGSGWIPPAPRPALPGMPAVGARSVDAPVYGQRGQRYVYDGFARRAIASGDYPLGYRYDSVLARSFATAPAPYAQPGPSIIVLGTAPAAQPGDPMVIPAPPEADLRPHGVRVVYLTDPPAEFQMQAGARARPRKGAVPEMSPIKPKY